MSDRSGTTTDSLLHKGHTPSYGINDSEEEEETAGGIRLTILHSKERIWTVAVFSLIACIGSVVIGLFLGYSTNTLKELSDLQQEGDETYGVAKGSWTASWFGVSLTIGTIPHGEA